MSDSVRPHRRQPTRYGYATHVVELNDDGTVKRVTAIHDLGVAVNPRAAEGQIEGGVVMGLG